MWLGHPAVRGGCAISGVYELGPIRDTYLNEKLQLSDDEIETLSPLRLPHGGEAAGHHLWHGASCRRWSPTAAN